MSRQNFLLISILLLLLIFSPFQNLQADVQTISLYEGWNLISFQVEPLNTDVNTLPSLFIDPVTGENDPTAFICIWGYESQANSWRVYQADSSVLNDLTCISMQKIETKKGYWINMAKQTDLVVEGTIAEGYVNFEKGWNLVGFTGFSMVEDKKLDIEQVFGPYMSYFDQIWNFDAKDTQEFKGYDPQTDPPIHDFDYLEEGSGYCIYAKKALSFSPFMSDNCYILQYGFNGVDSGFQEGECDQSSTSLRMITNVGATFSGISNIGDMKLSVGIVSY